MAASDDREDIDIQSYLAVGNDPLSRATNDYPEILPDPEGGGQGLVDKPFKEIKKRAKELFEEEKAAIADIQPALWSSKKRALLIVFQGMDSSGKDTTINHVFAEVNVQGIEVSAFKSPSEDEKLHDFLWRVAKCVPRKGTIGIFNRSHYEDVIFPFVHGLMDEATARQRLAHLKNWEAYLNDQGISIIKIFLHISKVEQARRLRHRLITPDKIFKIDKGDFAERVLWDKYTQAYNLCLSQTHTEFAPWFVVPADLKRDTIVAAIVHHALQRIDPKFPEPAENIQELSKQFMPQLDKEIAEAG